MKNYDDAGVVITGGATGIGFALAKRFGERGARVMVAEMRQERIDEAVAALRSLDIEAHGALCDVRQREQVEALADQAWSALGRVDVIVNNAGIGGRRSSVIDARREDIDAVLATNLFGVWNGTSVFGARFLEQGTPAGIYNVGSENSFFHATTHMSPYVVSKFGVRALTEALREEVPDFIHVALVVPGWVRSELGPHMDPGMDTDRYSEIVIEQLQDGAFYVVSHAFNAMRIDERTSEIQAAFSRYAPRYEGDDEYDVRSVIAEMQSRRSESD